MAEIKQLQLTSIQRFATGQVDKSKLVVSYYERSLTSNYSTLSFPRNLTGIIWPGPKEKSGRVNSQLDFARRYADQLRPADDSNKLILLVGQWLWETWVQGRKTFLDLRCPVDNCELTTDFKRYNSADLLMIGSGSGQELTRLLPKPQHQVNALSLRSQVSVGR